MRNDEEDETVIDALLDDVADKVDLIRGYSGGKTEIDGSRWVDKQIDRLKAKGNCPPEACAFLYLGLPENTTTWSSVSARGQEVETIYWQHARCLPRTKKNEAVSIAVEKLLDIERPYTALAIAGNSGISIDSLLIKRLLQHLVSIDSENKKSHPDPMDTFYVGHLFNQLYARKELTLEEIASLEWPFALIFENVGRHTSLPMALHRLLQRDPTFFAQLVSLVSKCDDGTPDREDEEDEHAENRARIAYEVLASWHLIPGLKDDGSIDQQELFGWIDEARQKCAETNHVVGGDLRIAFMLAFAPADKDGAWPHVAVRNLIEKLDNELMDKHIRVGVYNSRGVVSRGLNDGGANERGLVEKYKKMSDVVRVKWPRTAAMLRAIAHWYEGDAKREDDESDFHDLLWN